MSDIAIKVENLSKAYQLGEIGTGTISRDLERWVARILGKDDPFLRIGETNNRTVPGLSDVVWSLKDLDFEIKQGQAVGIIGNNGAGKSTLLKILSKITSPTTGRISGNGRIASLLEVGTGFHPELTGKENIYLNGAILGMRKKEIKRKFDEIVEFAGVGRYINTPVKRYSSGMYIRLAFAVAAHLESEILIVDEVLAVGDAEFQKKCLGKMGEVSKGEGRTVLFVSHTMSAVKQLCERVILLNKGTVEIDGPTKSVINDYLANDVPENTNELFLPASADAELYFKSVAIFSGGGNIQNSLKNDDDFSIQATFSVNWPIEDIEISICIRNTSGVNVFFTSLSDARNGILASFARGNYKVEARIPGNFLIPDTYTIDLYAHQRNVRNIDFRENALKFTIIDLGSYMLPYGLNATSLSCVLQPCTWTLTEEEKYE